MRMSAVKPQVEQEQAKSEVNRAAARLEEFIRLTMGEALVV
jgi:hypothetical protein